MSKIFWKLTIKQHDIGGIRFHDQEIVVGVTCYTKFECDEEFVTIQRWILDPFYVHVTNEDDGKDDIDYLLCDTTGCKGHLDITESNTKTLFLELPLDRFSIENNDFTVEHSTDGCPNPFEGKDILDYLDPQELSRNSPELF